MFGPTHEVVSEYEKQAAHEVVSLNQREAARHPVPTAPEPKARLAGWSVQGARTTGLQSMLASHERVVFRLEIELSADIAEGSVSIAIADFQGLTLFTQQERICQVQSGHVALLLELPLLSLKPGEDVINCTISENDHPIAFLRGTPELTILEAGDPSRREYHGLLHLPAKLSVEVQLDTDGTGRAARANAPLEKAHRRVGANESDR